MSELNCLRCLNRWVPRNKEKLPGTCPKCSSPYWNKPRKNQVGTIPSNSAGTSPESESRVCRIAECGHKWVSRIDKPPIVCPKCHSRNWNSGITPRDARAYLSRMFNSTCLAAREFAFVVGMDTTAMAKYLRGEPMTLAMLTSVESILRLKGYKFLGQKEHEQRMLELEEVLDVPEGETPTVEAWEKYLQKTAQSLRGEGHREEKE